MIEDALYRDDVRPVPDELIAAVDCIIGIAVMTIRAVAGEGGDSGVDVGMEENGADMSGLTVPVPLIGCAQIRRWVRRSTRTECGAGIAQ